MYEPFGLKPPARMPWRLRAVIEAHIERLIALLDSDDGDLDVEWNGDELGDPSWPDRGLAVGGIKWFVCADAAGHRGGDHHFDFDGFEAVALASAAIGEDDEICPDAAGEGDLSGNGHLCPFLPSGLDQTAPLNSGHGQ